MKTLTIVLVGQPNVGKSSLINALGNAKMRVGNFSGVTVEKAQATLQYKDYMITMIDLPGTYSLNGYTMEEKVCKDFLLHEEYDFILNVVDSTHLENNLTLTLQLQKLDKQMFVALNMIDEAKKDGIELNIKKLSQILQLGVCAVSSVHKQNLDTLLDAIIQTHENYITAEIEANLELQEQKQDLQTQQKKPLAQNKHNSPTQTPQALHWRKPTQEELKDIKITSTLAKQAKDIANTVQKLTKMRAQSSAKIDSILLHPFWSIPIFLFLMFCVFQISFVLGKYFQDLIEAQVDDLAVFVGSYISHELFASLLADGIIKGVGAVISFLPLIATLFLGLTLLETSGYMARVAFILDGLFFKFGLHGKSFVPLVMGFGCSVPAYMATRTLQNKRDKLLTLFIIGFMSCSARLPIYLLFVGAFFPLEYAGFILFLIYLGGFVIALILAKILRVCVFRGDNEPFIMEMPRYRIPTPQMVWFSVWSKTYLFLKKAGTIILAGAIFVWCLANFPKSQALQNSYELQITQLAKENLPKDLLEEQKSIYENKLLEAQLEHSFAGRLGHMLEPIFAPLGFDWRLSVALVAGFSAKEMVVTTLGVLYALGDGAEEDEEKNKSLQEILQKSLDTPACVAFILFIMLYIPCFAATVAFMHESGKKVYGIYLFIFTTCVAYLFAYLGHEITKIFIG